MTRKTGLAALLIVFAVAAPPALSAELVMFEERGCPWCRRWHDEVGPGYPRSAEGRRAPLRIVDMHGPRPLDLAHIVRVTVSPTFVVVDGGREIGRITGYPGADFFWGLLGEIVARLPAAQRPPGASQCPGAPAPHQAEDAKC